MSSNTESKLRSNPDFMKLWAAQGISAFGSKITREAIPYTAVIVLAATPGEMGLLSAITILPVVLLSLPAGSLADAVRRRPIMIAADLARALILASVPVAALLEVLTLPHLIVVAALTAVLSLLFDVADRAFLPVVVRRGELFEANSKLATTSSLAEVGGPAVSGALVQVVTAPMAIAIDAVSFLVSAFFLGLIRTPERRLERPKGSYSAWREMVVGLRVVLGNATLRAIALGRATRDFFGWFFGALYVLFLVNDLGLEPGIVGLMVASGGIGALLGALVANRVVRRFGVGATIIGGAFVAGSLSGLTPLAAGPLPVIILFLLAAQVLGDLFSEVHLISETSLRQMIVPHELLGRANAGMHFLVAGVGPVGALAGGALGEVLGARSTLMISVAGMALSALWLFFSPLRHMRELPAEVPDSDERTGTMNGV
jgi:MFS family permease